MSDLAPGTILGGDFELVRPLGEGGMGVVWLARERPLDRDVALKVMRPSDSRTRERRFEREARALAALDHPSILPVLRTGVDSATGLHYIATRAALLTPEEIRHLCDEVFHCPYPRSHAEGAEAPARWESHAEFAEGAEAPARWKSHAESAEGAEPPPLPLSLGVLLEGGKALPEATVLRIACDLAGALAAAHAAGILHRDLKPSNILFEASGRALLADFGLAKFLEAQTESPDGRAPSRSEGGPGAVEAPDSLSLDESGARKFLGSPAYAAPEQFREGAVSTPALDWYSFGAVLYEALTGERPRSLRRPSSFDPAHISRRWDVLLAALLESDPARRLSDPAAILRALDRIEHAEPRHRWWIVVGFVVCAAILLAAHFRQQSHAERARAAGPRAPVDATSSSHADALSPTLRTLEPAAISPPRLSSIWQGDDRGPLQLLNTFRLPAVDDVEDESIAAADPQTQRLLREGDAAWTASPRDVVAANNAYHAAAVRLRDAMAATGGGGTSPSGEPTGDSADGAACPPDAALRVCRAIALARLSWTYVVTATHGAADAPYSEALEILGPLLEADADRYGPLRSWLLAERAYMECMEDRFGEALGDLKEAAILWERHTLDDAVCEAHAIVLMASIGGMARKIDERAAALEITSRAIESLSELSVGEGGTGGGTPPAFDDLLAGCHYRCGELLWALGSRLETVQSYRKALDVWGALFQSEGEPYRLTYVQVLERIGHACGDMGRHSEAIAAWEKMLETLRPLVESDPKQYGPIDASIRENIDKASRALGDENRAAAAEAADADGPSAPHPAP